jgi:endoglucanase
MRITRRRFVTRTAQWVGAATVVPGLSGSLGAADLPSATAKNLPRWRGFNLLEKFTSRKEGNPPFAATDFELIEELGFNFVRLPMSYLCWGNAQEPLQLREPELKHIDNAVELGRKHHLHVNLNFHRAPGYCVNPPKEPLDLWNDEKALAACCFHWAHFAKRYKGIGNERVSFDLLNEPPDIPEATYARVVREMVRAIRAEDSNRLIVADGLRWGTQPVVSLADLGIAQSTRGYEPMRISHFKASWISGSDKWPEPTWPLKEGDQIVWDREKLRQQRIEPWKNLREKGVGVHVGEWGAFNKTPHPVALAWMRDCLALWKEAGFGWALWNFRGSFGVLDSERSDVHYESFRGHQLDRKMMDLLQQG